MPMTLVLEGDDRTTIDRRLAGGPIGIDGFVVAALSSLGIDATTLARAIRAHVRRDDRRDPVSLPLPGGYALHGEMFGGRFETDRLEMDDCVWFARGSAGMPHVVIRRPHDQRDARSVVGRDLDLGTALPTAVAGPRIRSAASSPQGWLYMDVDPVDCVI